MELIEIRVQVAVWNPTDDSKSARSGNQFNKLFNRLLMQPALFKLLLCVTSTNPFVVWFRRTWMASEHVRKKQSATI
jgi:hypothetical protein